MKATQMPPPSTQCGEGVPGSSYQHSNTSPSPACTIDANLSVTSAHMAHCPKCQWATWGALNPESKPTGRCQETIICPTDWLIDGKTSDKCCTFNDSWTNCDNPFLDMNSKTAPLAEKQRASGSTKRWQKFFFVCFSFFFCVCVSRPLICWSLD